jgi:hypothetical protein
MRLGRIILHRFRSLLRRSHAEAELQREIDLHIEQLTRELVVAGMTESEARLAAEREFGSLEVTKEECRDVRRIKFIEDLVRDLAYAFRLLTKSPGFTLYAAFPPTTNRPSRCRSAPCTNTPPGEAGRSPCK